jgi:hypothetical protein
MVILRYPSYPVSRGIDGQPSLRGYKYREWRHGPPGWGLGVRLTTSPCKNKFVENLLRGGKILEEAKAVVPLILRGCHFAYVTNSTERARVTEYDEDVVKMWSFCTFSF